MQWVSAVGSAQAQGPSPALVAEVTAVIDAYTARLTAIVKDIHQNPEIGFTETRTAAIVAKELKDLGYVVTTGNGRAGVVGVFRNGTGPTLWFRADMDANANTTAAPTLLRSSCCPALLLLARCATPGVLASASVRPW